MRNYMYKGNYLLHVHAVYSDLTERFSDECHETKTKVIILVNHKGHRQYNSDPIKS